MIKHAFKTVMCNWFMITAGASGSLPDQESHGILTR